MKYTVIHSCGHEEEVVLFGNNRDRERKLEWLASIPCKECQKAMEQQAIKERTKELGLPELQGTEKQVAWALGIRISRIADLHEQAGKLSDKIASLEASIEAVKEKEGEAALARLERYEKRLVDTRSALANTVEAIDGVSAITKASWWIDHRDEDGAGMTEAYKAYKGVQMEKAIEEETKPTMVIMEPENKKTGTVVMLKATKGAILLTCERDEHVRLTVKKHGFTWDGSRTAWVKAATEMTGPAKDLAPDTARILLEAGIPVRAYPDVAEAVQAGTYEPECHRWIESAEGKAGDRLAIRKAKGVSDYPEGKPTLKDDYILVSPSLWREVREFAAMNGYHMTRAAEEMLRKEEKATVTVRPAAKAGKTAGGTDALKAILESSRDVLEDLKDDD